LKKSNRIVAAELSERQYALARLAVPALQEFHDYADWLDFREGSLFGLSVAGFHVDMVAIDLPSFVSWCRRTSTPPSVGALDEFAGLTAVQDLDQRRRDARLG
jgi:hypothetical protein